MPTKTKDTRTQYIMCHGDEAYEILDHVPTMKEVQEFANNNVYDNSVDDVDIYELGRQGVLPNAEIVFV